MFGSGQILLTSEPIQICTNHQSINQQRWWTDHPHETVQINQETINVSSRCIPKYNITVVHVVKLKTAIRNIQVHGEDGDGGWKIWQEIETRLYTALDIFLQAVS